MENEFIMCGIIVLFLGFVLAFICMYCEANYYTRPHICDNCNSTDLEYRPNVCATGFEEIYKCNKCGHYMDMAELIRL